ncbi:hypothetical protein OGAPHI_002741 [Ogataea philodendri]|uniref:Uncharacterized protein n=1 Tax=Ogataea philodendri TaxID=1378263 RepID=A0A9P8T7M7_9ASCO|nr:uncharacterized protein OGAPHI_002741 [Ogataea philodendri]KAH3668986.1 hypothetical protein OGAPHI_002741 [Ogataea philodendri]
MSAAVERVSMPSELVDPSVVESSFGKGVNVEEIEFSVGVGVTEEDEGTKYEPVGVGDSVISESVEASVRAAVPESSLVELSSTTCGSGVGVMEEALSLEVVILPSPDAVHVGVVDELLASAVVSLNFVAPPYLEAVWVGVDDSDEDVGDTLSCSGEDVVVSELSVASEFSELVVDDSSDEEVVFSPVEVEELSGEVESSPVVVDVGAIFSAATLADVDDVESNAVVLPVLTKAPDAYPVVELDEVVELLEDVASAGVVLELESVVESVVLELELVSVEESVLLELESASEEEAVMLELVSVDDSVVLDEASVLLMLDELESDEASSIAAT